MIEIDPNVRVRLNHTFSYVNTTGLREGDAIVAHEPECGLAWPATIVTLNHETGYIELDVAWEKGRHIS